MRIYDFDCRGCGTRFEALVGSEHDKPPCPACGAGAVERCTIVRMAVHARKGPRGRVIDLSSHACPCAAPPKRAETTRG